MKTHSSRSSRGGAPWLRAVVGPFILGLALPMVVCVATLRAPTGDSATYQPDLRAAGAAFTIALLVVLVVTGALARAVCGRDRAPAGFVSAIAGLGALVLWAGYAPTGLDVDSFVIFGIVLACLAIPLAIGWTGVDLAIRLATGSRLGAGPSQTPDHAGLVCGRCGEVIPLRRRDWNCPGCGALLSAFPPIKREAPPVVASDAPQATRPA